MHAAKRELRQINMAKRESIERLGGRLRNINMLTAPLIILAIAIGLGVQHAVRRRRSISHASDAATAQT